MPRPRTIPFPCHFLFITGTLDGPSSCGYAKSLAQKSLAVSKVAECITLCSGKRPRRTSAFAAAMRPFAKRLWTLLGPIYCDASVRIERLLVIARWSLVLAAAAAAAAAAARLVVTSVLHLAAQRRRWPSWTWAGRPLPRSPSPPRRPPLYAHNQACVDIRLRPPRSRAAAWWVTLSSHPTRVACAIKPVMVITERLKLEASNFIN